jgi:hypothetical protein
MAEKTIAELTEETAFNYTDLIPVANPSTGTAKKMTLTRLRSGLGAVNRSLIKPPTTGWFDIGASTSTAIDEDDGTYFGPPDGTIGATGFPRDYRARAVIGPPFQMVTGFMPNFNVGAGTPNVTDALRCGVFIMDESLAANVTFDINAWSGAPGLRIQALKFDNVTGISGLVEYGVQKYFNNPGPTFLKIVRDATNTIFLVSSDGVHYNRWLLRANVDIPFTPAYYGYFVGAETISANSPFGMKAFHFEESA